MSDKFQPQLSAKVRKDKGVAIYEKDMACVTWPKLISPKLDGIRTWNPPAVVGGIARPHPVGLYSRTMKLIPNVHMQRTFGTEEFIGLDGEGIHGDPFGQSAMQRSTSGCMTQDGPPDVTVYAFNFVGPGKFEDRLERLEQWRGHPQVSIVEHQLVYSWAEVEEKTTEFLLQEFEGSMLADPLGEYTMGRASLSKGISIKVKIFDDMEGQIIGFEERYSNQNEQRLDERGYSKRSSHQENQVPMDTLGAFVCKSPLFKKAYKVGTGIGLNDEFRKYVWEHKEEFLGQWMTHTYHKLRSFERPSLPSYRGIRYDYDGPQNENLDAIGMEE